MDIFENIILHNLLICWGICTFGCLSAIWDSAQLSWALSGTVLSAVRDSWVQLYFLYPRGHFFTFKYNNITTKHDYWLIYSTFNVIWLTKMCQNKKKDFKTSGKDCKSQTLGFPGQRWVKHECCWGQRWVKHDCCLGQCFPLVRMPDAWYNECAEETYESSEQYLIFCFKAEVIRLWAASHAICNSFTTVRPTVV